MNIRPDAQELVKRGNVTLEEWKNFRGNSYEMEAIIPVLTNEALAHVARHYVENCGNLGRRPFVSYKEAVPGLIVPELLRRLGEGHEK